MKQVASGAVHLEVALKQLFWMYDLRFSRRWLWRVSSSEIKPRVVRWVTTEVLEEHIASIFRVKKISLENSACHLLALRFLAELTFFALKMDAIYSSETSVDTQRTARRYIPEDDTNHSECYFSVLCVEVLGIYAVVCLHVIKPIEMPGYEPQMNCNCIRIYFPLLGYLVTICQIRNTHQILFEWSITRWRNLRNKVLHNL
jgi:hypothetical protein